MTDSIVIVDAVRTAIGSFGGSLSSLPAHQLGATLIRAILERNKLSAEQINEVILGQVLTAGVGQNPARQAALVGGLNYETPALTVNHVCGSGLKAVHLAMQSIRCGDSDIVIAGGQESMSQSAHILPRSREGQKMGNWPLIDSMVTDGLWDAFNDYHMGITAENIAKKYEISREQQDQFAADSQQKTALALSSNRFANEIIPVDIPQRKGESIRFERDEYPRETSAEKLAGLRPVFDKEGSVTAGNASGINDGAAAALVMSENKAQELGFKPMARIVAFASAGVDPAYMGTGPIPASTKCLEKAGWDTDSLDRIEANEAFAAQALCVNQQMGWDIDKVNVNGGAISLGHPIGASGCRVLVSLLHEMQRNKQQRGLATLCIGGGQGVAMAVEKM